MANSAIVGILRALLVADTAQFDKALARSTDQARVWAKQLDKVGQQAKSVGAALTQSLTVPIAAIGVGAAKLAIDFESAFAGVRKTVDATDDELAAMSTEFRTLAKTIPISVEELARLGEAAGALNIPKKDVVDFARVMAELGVTTNVTSDQAAESIAQIQTIFQSSGKDTERFASTLVDLGNKGASTESAILALAGRIASAGRAIGLSQSQVLAYSAALANVGIEAEAGGTAISKVFADISKSVSLGSADLANFAKYSGLSVEKFSAAFKTDAADAVRLFIEGLGRAAKSGSDMNVMLDQLGVTETRQAKALRDLALSGDNLKNALNNSSTAWRDNTALSEEARKRFETTASQLAILWNRVKDVGITIGNALLPAIKSLIALFDGLLPYVEGIAKWFAKLPAGIQLVVGGFVALAASVGPVLFVLGQLLTSAGAVTAAFKKGGLAATGLGGVLNFMKDPITLAVIGLTALAGIIYTVATAETELEKEIRTNTKGFVDHTVGLRDALATYEALNGKANLTEQQTKDLATATDALALASGRTTQQFKDEAGASDLLLKSLHDQYDGRVALAADKLAQTKIDAAENTRALADARRQQDMIAAGQATVPTFGGGGLTDKPSTRPLNLRERTEQNDALNKSIAALNAKSIELAETERLLNVVITKGTAATAGLATSTGSVVPPTGAAATATRNLVAEYDALVAKVKGLEPAQRAQLDAGNKIGTSSKELAEITHIQVEVIDLYLKGAREVTKEHNTQADAVAKLEKGIEDLTTAQREQIAALVNRGAAEGVIAKALGVTAEQVRQVAAVEKDRLKGIKDLDAAWEKYLADERSRADQSASQVGANVIKIGEVQQQVRDEDEVRGKDAYQAELIRLRQRADADKAAFQGSAALQGQYADAVDKRTAQSETNARHKQALEMNQRAQQEADSAKKTQESWSKTFDKIGANLGSVIINAIQQGSNAEETGGAIGGVLGGSIGDTAGKMAAEAIGGTLGSTIGGIMGPLGAMAGQMLGKFAGKMFDKFFGSKGRDAVKKFAEAQGGFDALHEKLGTLGAEGEQLWIGLTQGVGKNNPEQAEAAIKKITDALAKQEEQIAAQAEALEGARTKVGELQNALQVFGGVVPSSLRPTVDALLQMSGLPEDMRAQLTAIGGDPSWQTMAARADDLGIKLTDLGPKFSQARISDIALGYARDLGMFADAGADMQGVIVGMSDELSTLYQDAAETGAALPATLKPYMATLVEQGLLLDKNGEKVKDLNEVAFKDIEDKALKDVVKVLDQIRELLEKGLPQAADKGAKDMAAAFAKNPVTVPYTFEQQGAGPAAPSVTQPQPGLSGGTHGAFVDWGAGTSVTLHGREAVVPIGEGLGGSTMITVISQLDGREVARNQVRYIPGELTRAGL